MSADRPNFNAIAARVRVEKQERFQRRDLTRTLDSLLQLQTEISGTARNSIDRIPVDDKGTLIRAVRYLSEDSPTIVEVRITSVDPRTGNSQEGLIFEAAGEDLKNSIGETLQGDSLKEAHAIVEVMREHLLDKWEKKRDQERQNSQEEQGADASLSSPGH